MKNENITFKRVYQKNDELELRIDDLGNEGEGIGHSQGCALFVRGALPGELVRVRVMKMKKTFGYARLLKVIEPSPDRVKPPCAAAGRCGGCNLLHLSYEGQLRYKEKKVKDCLARIGGVDSERVEWLPILGMEGDFSPWNYRNKAQFPVRADESGASAGQEVWHEEDFSPWNYRNKAQFPVRADEGGNPVAGFFAGRSHRLIPVEDCMLQHPLINRTVNCVMEFIKEYHIPPYDEEKHSGLVRHIYVRRGYYTGEIMVCLVINGYTLPHSDELVERLRQIPGMTGIYLNENTEKTNVILGSRMIPLWGSLTIEDRIGNLCFRIFPQSFYQVNPVQTERLYRTALEFADLKGNETVWDLYCGIGTISLFLAARAGRVIGVEIVPEAIENAIENARLNHIENAEFYCGAAEDVAARLAVEKGADVVVVDPPRKGCDGKLLNTIAGMRPGKIVYVSCDPGTLARDVKILAEKGYAVRKVRACDMFPGTKGVETVVELVDKIKKTLNI